MKPRISVLLPALLGVDRIGGALDAWNNQTCREQLEVLILCPDRRLPTADQRRSLAPGHVIVPVGSAGLHDARAIGIARALGDYIMLAEDHCLPDPDWTHAIIDRLDDGWDGVGPALRPGNGGSSRWAEASFLIGYGEWMMPVSPRHGSGQAGGPTTILCGFNGTIRTQLLRELGSELPNELVVGAFVVRRLGRDGRRFYFEDRARMRHFDPASWGFAVSTLATLGMGFGAKRTVRWPLAARLLYPLAAPGIALLHWRRAFAQYRRAGAGSGLRATAPAIALVLAAAWGVGEAAGALLGITRVSPHVWRAETRPVSREEALRR